MSRSGQDSGSEELNYLISQDVSRWFAFAPYYSYAGGGLYSADDIDQWQVVYMVYLKDRLDHAWDLAQKSGTIPGYTNGLFRTIESENITRERGQQRKIDDWLWLECREEELGASLEESMWTSQTICRQVAEAFSWKPDVITLISVALKDADTPWRTGRAGYYVDKYPYDKIVLPPGIFTSSTSVAAVLRHEYAHCMTTNSSRGHAPIWLSEAVSQVSGGAGIYARDRAFFSGEGEWHPPHSAGYGFALPDRDPKRAWAYRQSTVIGQYLNSLGGTTKIGEMLRAHADESFLPRLEQTLVGQDRTDAAMRKVYGHSTAQVFEQAREWLKAQV